MRMKAFQISQLKKKQNNLANFYLAEDLSISQSFFNNENFVKDMSLVRPEH